MSHSHVVIWIDHHEAQVIHFSLDDAQSAKVTPAAPHRHLHHKRGSTGSGHDKPDNAYFDEVAAMFSDAGEILIAGPANAKTELMQRLQKHHPALAKKIVGVETVDHPSAGELLKFARKYFTAADRMRGTLPTLHN